MAHVPHLMFSFSVPLPWRMGDAGAHSQTWPHQVFLIHRHDASDKLAAKIWHIQSKKKNKELKQTS